MNAPLPLDQRTPAAAWAALCAGNIRFVEDRPAHPHQDVRDRAELASGQHPFAVFFGCADSRVAAEIIFDQGLGDLFVVRTAGHIVDASVLGSLEFGVAVLQIPLIVVLGHDSCGAVRATLDAIETGDMPGGYIRDIVERVTPSVISAKRAGVHGVNEMGAEHVRHTTRLIAERSHVIADRIAQGRLAVVGATYALSVGEAKLVTSLGNVTN